MRLRLLGLGLGLGSRWLGSRSRHCVCATVLFGASLDRGTLREEDGVESGARCLGQGVQCSGGSGCARENRSDAEVQDSEAIGSA